MPPLHAFEVGQHQLGLDGFGVADRIDRAFDVRDVGVLEAAQNVNDRVHLADVGEELVAQAFALRGAAHQAGDIHELQARRHDLRRLADARQRIEPRIGNGDHADIRLDRAERIIRCLRRRGRGQRVEQR